MAYDKDTIQTDIAGEISAVTAKGTPVAADYLLIEDSAASDAKKSITIGTIPLAGVLGGTAAAATLDDGSVDGGKLATAASGFVDGTAICAHWITVTGAADGDQTITVTDKIQVVDVQCINDGAGTAGSIVTVKNGSNAITDAIDVSGADNTVARAATVDNAQSTVAAAGTLTFSRASTGQDFAGCRCIVYSIRTA